MENFVFGGEAYIIKCKINLTGMEYYHVLENVKTGETLYLYCYPDR